MGKLITVATVTPASFALSNQVPAHVPGTTELSFALSLNPPPIAAARTQGNRRPVMVKQITLSCACSGMIGGNPFTGTGTAMIVANTPRVKCERESVLVEGDQTTLTCSGTISTPGGPVTGAASVTVTIADTGQTSVRAGTT